MGQGYLQSISHPELELRMNAIGNEYSEHAGYFPHQTSMDILEVYPDGKVVEKEGFGCEQFANYCGLLDIKHQADNMIEDPEPLIRVFFLHDLFTPPATGVNQPYLPPKVMSAVNMNDLTAVLLHRYFGVPILFLQDLIPVITYRTIGNATFIRKDKEGGKISIDGYYQLCSDYISNKVSYTWFSMSLQSGKSSNYVIHKCPNIVKQLMVECAKGPNPLSLSRPFVIDAFLMNDCVMRMNREMMNPRQSLIKIEQTSFGEPMQYESKEQIQTIKLLHNIGREFRLMKDTLHSVQDTMDYMVDVQSQHAGLTSSESTGTEIPDMDSVRESFAILKSKANWITRELSSLVDRASLKIGLEYSLANQRDSRTQVNIATLTKDIAFASQEDSSSMITMAAVTMFFLPGTFVSAIFSMAFFSSSGEQGKLGVAPLWWLFPAITIPLTILVFLVWIFWRRHRNAIKQKKLRALTAQDPEMSFETESAFSYTQTRVSNKWYRKASKGLFRWRFRTASAQRTPSDNESNFDKE
ncbi:hypothetical protein GALMADRAFT_280149 [Galerina marginata CBS 339.88]|uniref:Uncharacterized protein n=1 Tax=Galerina marginata (strain CBS 339.88) TaxID=685588 RepID=A0A067SUX8_GALM3|nr:hypothetical protein GALMADRAFT_280149 [Galerina marginata CBS 339.88]